MHELIITRILTRGVVTLSELEGRATKRGLSLSELYAALDKVHRDQRVTRKVLKGEVTYVPTPKRSEVVNTHITWVKENYPWPSNFIMPFPEWDLSFLFLTPEQLLEYKSAAKNVPVHMLKKKYAR